MKFQEVGHANSTVNFALWGKDGSTQPRNAAAETAIKTKIKVNGKAVEAATHPSKGGANYTYAQVEGKWMWTRDTVNAEMNLEPYVKPVPAPKEPKAPKAPKEAKAKAEPKAKATPKATTPKATKAKDAAPAPADGEPVEQHVEPIND